jgi:acyl-CoA synthetase (NDP forming)
MFLPSSLHDLDLKVLPMNEVKTIFEPKSVALIGSSKIRERVGMSSPQLFGNVTYNMKRFYKKKAYVVDIEGYAGYKGLKRLPETPDLAVVMLPPDQSIVQAEKCAEKGIKTLVLITGGYKDAQRANLLKLKETYGIRFLGPNTIMGVVNTANGLNTTFEIDLMPEKGNISVISQASRTAENLSKKHGKS